MVDMEVLVVSSLVVFQKQVMVASLVNCPAFVAIQDRQNFIHNGWLRIKEQICIGLWLNWAMLSTMAMPAVVLFMTVM